MYGSIIEDKGAHAILVSATSDNVAPPYAVHRAPRPSPRRARVSPDRRRRGALPPAPPRASFACLRRCARRYRLGQTTTLLFSAERPTATPTVTPHPYPPSAGMRPPKSHAATAAATAAVPLSGYEQEREDNIARNSAFFAAHGLPALVTATLGTVAAREEGGRSSRLPESAGSKPASPSGEGADRKGLTRRPLITSTSCGCASATTLKSSQLHTATCQLT
jgi:hypothetical protein